MYIGLQLSIIAVYNNFTHICIKWSNLSKSFVTYSYICYQLDFLAIAFH